MLLTLEAVQAGCGDCLLLHYQGASGKPKLIVIDGGPGDTYANYLEPRLLEIRDSRSPNDRLKLDLVLVSHVDDDHATGIEDLTGRLVGGDKSFRLANLWMNSFEDVTPSGGGSSLAAAVGAAMGAAYGDAGSALAACLPPGGGNVTAATIKQGRQIRLDVEHLGGLVNDPLGSPITGPTGGGQWTAKLGDGLTFTVLAPAKKQLDDLHAKWDEEVAKLAKPAEAQAAATRMDDSITNLSSIAVLAEAGGRSLLLLGDARGDMVLDGLRGAGKMSADDTFHADVLKLPHHGSKRNVKKDFLEKITADHYVICANGKDKNPDTVTLDMLTTARGNAAYTVYLTNKVDHAAAFFEKDTTDNGRAYDVQYGTDGPPYLSVDLGDQKLGY